MKKNLLVILCCIFLCGCNIKKEEYTICKKIDSNYHLQFILYPDKNTEYIIKEQIISEFTYDTLSEAIEAEQDESEICQNSFDGEEIIKCEINRKDKTIISDSIINISKKVSYIEQIKKLEKSNYICKKNTN